MRALTLLMTIGSLGGCAAGIDSPSLAPRPIEARFNAPEAPLPPPAPPPPADASLTAQVASLLQQLRAGQTAFDAALPAAQAAVAGAGAPQSESWIVAQLRLSALEGARGPSTLALGAIDALLLGRADAVARGAAEGGVAELAAAQAEAERTVQAQQARLDGLRARLSG